MSAALPGDHSLAAQTLSRSGTLADSHDHPNGNVGDNLKSNFEPNGITKSTIDSTSATTGTGGEGREGREIGTTIDENIPTIADANGGAHSSSNTNSGGRKSLEKIDTSRANQEQQQKQLSGSTTASTSATRRGGGRMASGDSSEVAPAYDTVGQPDSSTLPTGDVKAKDHEPTAPATKEAEGSASHAANVATTQSDAAPLRPGSVTGKETVTSPTNTTHGSTIPSPKGSSMAGHGKQGSAKSDVDKKAVKKAMADQHQYEKVLQKAAKDDQKQVKEAVRAADKAGKEEAHAAKMEVKSKKAFDSASKKEYKANKALLKAKAAHDKAAANLESVKTTYELKRKHHEELIEERQNTLNHADELRKQKGSNDDVRAKRRETSMQDMNHSIGSAGVTN